MKKVLFSICTKLASCALLAAVVSAGVASCNGMYEPKMPESLQK